MYLSQGLVWLQEICKWHLSLNDKKLQQYEHLPWPSTNHKDKTCYKLIFGQGQLYHTLLWIKEC